MARLRKSGPEELRTFADNLVKKWKKSVNPSPTPAESAEAAKRPRSFICTSPQYCTGAFRQTLVTANCINSGHNEKLAALTNSFSEEMSVHVDLL